MVTHDFLFAYETHGTLETITAAKPFRGCEAFWSPSSSSQAGVGIVLKESFVRNFNPIQPHDFVGVEPGRVAKRSLRGPEGFLTWS